MADDTSNAVLLAAINKIIENQQRSLDKLETALANMVPRIEYEARHVTLEQMIASNNLSIAENNRRISEMGKWALEEHEKLGLKLSQIDENANKRIDELVDKQSNSRETTIRYIVTVIVSIVIGIALPLLIQILTRR